MDGTQQPSLFMRHPETDDLLVRGERPFTVRYGGFSETVMVTGDFPPGTEGTEVDGVLVGTDLEPTEATLRRVKAHAADPSRDSG